MLFTAFYSTIVKDTSLNLGWDVEMNDFCVYFNKLILLLCGAFVIYDFCKNVFFGVSVFILHGFKNEPLHLSFSTSFQANS